MKKSKVRSERDEELESDILNDIQNNLEKIIHHGKRADVIVKGMLQHSQRSNGQKEPTDINKLADEYLRLSYHARLNDNVGQARLNGAAGLGMRAKDKSQAAGKAGFPATIKTDFDESIGSIEIIPQDIGRVLLNLYNNAFYAVAEKAKKEIPSYKPTVVVSTKKRRG